MTGCAVGRQPSAAPVAFIAGELRMLPEQWPGMIEFFRRRDLRRLRQCALLRDNGVAKLAVFT